MELQEFLNHLNKGAAIESGTPLHAFMHRLSQEAMRVTARLNEGYHAPEEVRALFAELTSGRELYPVPPVLHRLRQKHPRG